MKIFNAVFTAAMLLSSLIGVVQTADASGNAAIAKANPYDESADAALEIQQALAQAKIDKIPVLLVFGANWCGDCKILDASIKTGTAANMISRDFKVVKVNVGKLDKNVAIAEQYGVPLKKGIPAVAIISPENTVLFATRAGELADARKMGDIAIYEFFKKAAVGTKAKS